MKKTSSSIGRSTERILIICICLLLVIFIVMSLYSAHRIKECEASTVKMATLEQTLRKFRADDLTLPSIDGIYKMAGSSMGLMIAYPIEYKNELYRVVSDMYHYLDIMSPSQEQESSYWNIQFMTMQLINAAYHNKPIAVTKKQFERLKQGQLILNKTDHTCKFEEHLSSLTSNELMDRYFVHTGMSSTRCMSGKTLQDLVNQSLMDSLIYHLFAARHMIILRTDISGTYCVEGEFPSDIGKMEDKIIPGT
jgi:hypothetical protein